MSKDGVLYVRICSVERNTFTKRCKDIDRADSDVVREIITAFNEGRLKIIPTDGQKTLNKELYNVD